MSDDLERRIAALESPDSASNRALKHSIRTLIAEKLAPLQEVALTQKDLVENQRDHRTRIRELERFRERVEGRDTGVQRQSETTRYQWQWVSLVVGLLGAMAAGLLWLAQGR